MGNFLDKFPKVDYDINRNLYTNYETITDLTFRFSVIKDVLDNVSAYYEYVIRDGETPEILADRIYGDAQSYWIILYANDIVDPQYDWPLGYDAFEKYIINKYGSITQAKSTIHHYEKLLVRQVDNSETEYLERTEVTYSPYNYILCTYDNQANNITVGTQVTQFDPAINDINFEGSIVSTDLPNNQFSLTISYGRIKDNLNIKDKNTQNTLCRIIGNDQQPGDYYITLPADPQSQTFVINNKRITETVARNAISCYYYEAEQNEKKRFIKVIKKEYYGQIMREFINLTKSDPRFFRRLV